MWQEALGNLPSLKGCAYRHDAGQQGKMELNFQYALYVYTLLLEKLENQKSLIVAWAFEAP